MFQQSVRDCHAMQTVLKGQLYFNYRTSPCHSTRWAKTLARAVDELIELLRAPMLMLLWKRICFERGWGSPEEVGRSAREEFICNLRFSKCVQTQGELVAWSRWYSIVRREREERDEWIAHCLPLIYYCICSGFVSRQWQIFKAALERAEVKTAVTAATASLSDAVAPEGAASSSDAKPPALAPTID